MACRWGRLHKGRSWGGRRVEIEAERLVLQKRLALDHIQKPWRCDKKQFEQHSEDYPPQLRVRSERSDTSVRRYALDVHLHRIIDPLHETNINQCVPEQSRSIPTGLPHPVKYSRPYVLTPQILQLHHPSTISSPLCLGTQKKWRVLCFRLQVAFFPEILLWEPRSRHEGSGLGARLGRIVPRTVDPYDQYVGYKKSSCVYFEQY